jgi:glutathione S-transferase
MADIILHHYWLSPYAEKIRRILGFKNLAWKSVEIPIVAPKPDLTALTGGYRKTPVLQIGADVYCDTDCIARVLERLQPEPTLFPPGTEALSYMVGSWQQELFWHAVQLAGATGDVFPPGFVEDRNTMIPGGLDLEKLVTEIPATRDRLRAKLGSLEGLLADDRPYLLGDRASLADFAVFHPLFALKSLGPTAEVLAPYRSVRDWIARIEAFGHGTITQIESSEAIAAALRSEPATPVGKDDGDPNGRIPGDRVRIVHESFGNDPVVGEIVSSSAQQIAVRREDERTGEVVVHFPREHYVVLSAD